MAGSGEGELHPEVDVGRLRPARLAGFSLSPLPVASAVDSVTAIDRVESACHVIVAPPVVRVAAEHTVSRIGGAAPVRGVRAAAGPLPELEQVPVQGARRAPTP